MRKKRRSYYERERVNRIGVSGQHAEEIRSIRVRVPGVNILSRFVTNSIFIRRSKKWKSQKQESSYLTMQRAL